MPRRGECRFCGCTETTACQLITIAIEARAIERPAMHVDMCSWADETRTLCTNPGCLAKAANEKKARRSAI